MSLASKKSTHASVAQALMKEIQVNFGWMLRKRRLAWWPQRENSLEKPVGEAGPSTIGELGTVGCPRNSNAVIGILLKLNGNCWIHEVSQENVVDNLQVEENSKATTDEGAMPKRKST